MPHVPTTAGEIDVADLGPVLMHEHVFIRTEALQQGWPGFGGWDADAALLARMVATPQAVWFDGVTVLLTSAVVA